MRYRLATIEFVSVEDREDMVSKCAYYVLWSRVADFLRLLFPYQFGMA